VLNLVLLLHGGSNTLIDGFLNDAVVDVVVFNPPIGARSTHGMIYIYYYIYGFVMLCLKNGTNSHFQIGNPVSREL